MTHFLIQLENARWRWTLYGGTLGALARGARDFPSRADCEEAVRIVQRAVRCAAICYAEPLDDDS